MSKGLETFKDIVNSMYWDDSPIIICPDKCEIVEKELRVLEIIRNYGYFDCQGDLIVRLPTNRKEEYDLLKETLR